MPRNEPDPLYDFSVIAGRRVVGRPGQRLFRLALESDCHEPRYGTVVALGTGETRARAYEGVADPACSPGVLSLRRGLLQLARRCDRSWQAQSTATGTSWRSRGESAVSEVERVVATDAGMFMLWQPEAFAAVHDYDSWAVELEDDADIARHVRAGHCVPVNIGQDFAAAFVVRVATDEMPAELSVREATYLVVASEPYLFESEGGAHLDGIENVGSATGPRLEVPAGRWAVTAHIIDWEAEPGAKQPTGRPAGGALPDFVVLLNRAPAEGMPFRTAVATFPPPQA